MPVIADRLELTRPELAVVGCMTDPKGPVTALGLMPVDTLADHPWSEQKMCEDLPETSTSLDRFPLLGIDGDSGSSGIKRAFEACTADMKAARNTPVFKGPETVSSKAGSPAKGVLVGEVVDKALSEFGKWVDTLSPEGQIGAGAALGLVVAPTLIAIGVAAADKNPVVAAGAVAAGVKAGIEGAVMVAKGIAAKAKESEKQPPTPQPPPEAEEKPKPEPPKPEGTPSEPTPEMPDSCARALAMMAACLGKRTCDDPMAQEFEMARKRACANVDPTYLGVLCAEERPPTDEELSEALAAVCAAYWSDKMPPPGEPMTCPLANAAAQAGFPNPNMCFFGKMIVQCGNVDPPYLPERPGPFPGR